MAAAKQTKSYRGAEASPTENMLIARSFIAASEDKQVGNNMKTADFIEKHSNIYWKMAKDHYRSKKEGFDTIDLERPGTFPTTRWLKLRKSVHNVIAVRVRNPKTSGDNDRREWLKRIRPLVSEELKKKGLPHSKPQQLEAVTDYLETKVKFRGFMDSEEEKAASRPSGTKKAKLDQKIAAVKGKVDAKLGVPGTESLFAVPEEGGDAPAAGFLKELQHGTEQLLEKGLQQLQGDKHERMAFDYWKYQEQERKEAQRNAQTQQYVKLLALAMNPSSTVQEAAAAMPPVHVPPPLPPPWVQQQQQRMSQQHRIKPFAVAPPVPAPPKGANAETAFVVADSEQEKATNNDQDDDASSSSNSSSSGKKKFKNIAKTSV